MSDLIVNAMLDDAMGDCDAVALAKRIANGEVSAAEVIEAAIARANKVNPKINAIVTDTYQMARNNVNKLGGGVFAGVPTFIKDNSDVAGVPTLNGTRALQPIQKTMNSEFVNQFVSTGLINLGKSSLPEFGIPPTTESFSQGASCNPWNIHHSTGGSSGGSAALVAAGVVPIAHANDGGGSIRIPAACCGLVGLKPTRNRLVNHDGTDSLPINVVHEGVLTRSVRDTAIFMGEAEKHFRNPNLPTLGTVENPGKKRLRIGLLTNALGGVTVKPDVVNVLNETARLCESLGHSIEDISIPFSDQIGEDFLDYYGFLFFIIHRFGKHVFQQDFDKNKLEKLTYAFSRRFSRRALKFPLVLMRLRNATKTTESLFKYYDVILCPTLSSAAPKNGTLTNPAMPGDILINQIRNYAPFTALQNITGEPAISLPMGTSDNGLPIGMQFSATYGADKVLLELAYELEEAKQWRHIYQQPQKESSKATESITISKNAPALAGA